MINQMLRFHLDQFLLCTLQKMIYMKVKIPSLWTVFLSIYSLILRHLFKNMFTCSIERIFCSFKQKYISFFTCSQSNLVSVWYLFHFFLWGSCYCPLLFSGWCTTGRRESQRDMASVSTRTRRRPSAL